MSDLGSEYAWEPPRLPCPTWGSVVSLLCAALAILFGPFVCNRTGVTTVPTYCNPPLRANGIRHLNVSLAGACAPLAIPAPWPQAFSTLGALKTVLTCRRLRQRQFGLTIFPPQLIRATPDVAA